MRLSLSRICWQYNSIPIDVRQAAMMNIAKEFMLRFALQTQYMVHCSKHIYKTQYVFEKICKYFRFLPKLICQRISAKGFYTENAGRMIPPASVILEQITQSWRTKQRRIFVSGKERECRRSSATTNEQRHSQRQKDKSATAT
ncbi:MAG: hypothetical protein ACOX63_13310 [Christensenellales bacterium]